MLSWCSQRRTAQSLTFPDPTSSVMCLLNFVLHDQQSWSRLLCRGELSALALLRREGHPRPCFGNALLRCGRDTNCCCFIETTVHHVTNVRWSRVSYIDGRITSTDTSSIEAAPIAVVVLSFYKHAFKALTHPPNMEVQCALSIVCVDCDTFAQPATIRIGKGNIIWQCTMEG